MRPETNDNIYASEVNHEAKEFGARKNEGQ
jgi:hypothetical protein